MGIIRITTIYEPEIKPEGINFIKSLLENENKTALKHYSNFIIFKLKQFIYGGILLGDFFPMSKGYKEYKFKKYKS